MSGAGIIFGSMLQGLGNAASTYATNSGRDQERADLQREKLDAQREMQMDRLENQRTIAAMREPSGGGKGGGGAFISEVKPGSIQEVQMASEMGFESIPAFRQYMKTFTTGDKSGYEREVSTTTMTDDGDPYATTGSTTTTEKKLPEGYAGWSKEKNAMLAQITREFTFGDKYDDVEKGKGQAIRNDAAEAMLKNPGIDPDPVRERVAITNPGSDDAYHPNGTNKLNGEMQFDPASKTDQTEEGKDARKLVDSLRSRANSIREDIAKAETKAYLSPDAKKALETRKAELRELDGELKQAELRLTRGPTATPSAAPRPAARSAGTPAASAAERFRQMQQARTR